MINGTDGAVFHPLINRNELLYIFAADLCRYACMFVCVANLFRVKAKLQKGGRGFRVRFYGMEGNAS